MPSKLPIQSVLAVISITISAVSIAQQNMPPAVVEVDTVEEKLLAPTLWVPGTITSREDSKVASEVAGVLSFVSEAGDRLKKGEVLARVNERQLQLQLRRDEAELARLKAKLAFAQQQLERTESLSLSNSTAQFRIDELTMERDVLQQEIVLAEVRRDQTLYLIERSKIVAPFNGVVAQRFHQPGEHISIGEELLRLVNLDLLEVRAQAPIETSRHIAVGDEVSIKHEGELILLKLDAIIPIGDSVSRMFEVRAQIRAESLENIWLVGDAVSLALKSGQSQASMTVPRDALVLRNNEVFVYRVNAKNIAEKIIVKTGASDASRIAISGNLSSSERVVVRGAERLQDGQSVEIANQVANR